jgi:hypothetical protein
MKDIKKYQDKKWLRIQYYEKKLSVSEIAKECGTGITTISRWASRFEIREMRPYKGNRKGPENPYWRGGKYKDHTSGYIWVYNPDHPSCTKKGYVLEHRLIVEKFIGRYLRTNEIIHHKNKIKDDNKLKNLEMIVLGEPNCAKIMCPFCNKKFKVG